VLLGDLTCARRRAIDQLRFGIRLDVELQRKIRRNQVEDGAKPKGMLVADLTALPPDARLIDLVGGVVLCPSLEVGRERKIGIVERKDLVVAAEDDVALEPVDLPGEALLERGPRRIGAVVTSEPVAVHRHVVCCSVRRHTRQDDPLEAT
jgi:hypothetical protein